MKQEKIYLKDYLPPTFSVESLQLDFNLNEDFCRVIATSRLNRQNDGTLFLDGEEMKLVRVEIDGKALNTSEYSLSDKGLEILNPPAAFTLLIETELEPQKNTSLEGLYKSNGIFCTQCEAQGFRKITYFFDRPDVMTAYQVTIEADEKKYPVLLSNGDRLAVTSLGNGRHKASWKDPHKKPSYLFALVAGDLGVIRDNFTTVSGRKVNLEVYAIHGKQDKCWHAMESLKRSMKWDEDTFGLEYDLNDYMIVAIDDFNGGAMENKGLNVFNSRLVLADSQSATDLDFHNIESVIAHEYFHNWTGNRVTLRDWFQLSLKEGLTVFRDQEYSSDMTDRGVQRINDVDALRVGQFPEDAGPNSHPVRPESCMAVDNFFTMTIYEKGAEVIRMMQTIVGRKGFRKGMDEYFRRHDGQAVTTDDFAAAISEPNGKDFTQFKRWYTQAGTPSVHVLEKYDADKKEFSLTLKQTCPATPGQSQKEPFHIPLMMGLLNSKGEEMTLHCAEVTINTDGKHLIELKDAEKTFVFSEVNEKPVLSILREFSAPVHLKWEASDDDVYFLIANDKDSFNRREMTQKMATKVLSQMIAEAKKGTTPKAPAKFVEAMTLVILDASMDPAFKAKMMQLPSYSILAQQEDVLDAKAFETAMSELKKAIALANQKALIDIYNKCEAADPKAIDPKTMGLRTLKNTALHYLAFLGEDSAELLKNQYWSAKNMTDKMAALTLLADSQSSERQKAMDDFYANWKNDGVVLNKWFTVQAQSQRVGTLDDVRNLTKHPSFNMTNPNNVYSLLRSFGANIVRFHDPAVKAYEFYADMILAVDAKNPQVAARLCAAFNFVAKLNPEMQARAKEQIQRVLNNPQLSKNTRELLQSNA